MADRQDVAAKLIAELAEIVEIPAEELEDKGDARLAEDLGMHSMHFFPLISQIEQDYGIAVDYAAFLTASDTLDHMVDYVTSIAQA